MQSERSYVGLAAGFPRCASQELARGVRRLSVPADGDDLARIDNDPPVLALEADHAVGTKLHAGELVALGRGEPDRADPLDDHVHRSGFADEGLEQVTERLSGHEPPPPDAFP